MLTPEQITTDLIGTPESHPFRHLMVEVVRTVMAEVRKDDEALIRQMLEALTAPCAGEELLALKQAAIAAVRARLFDSDLSKLTERGAKAWAGVDPQKLREGGAL